MKRKNCLPIVLFTMLSVGLLIFSGPGVSSGSEDKGFTNSIGMRLVLIPAADFMMGSHEQAKAVATNPAYGDKPGDPQWHEKHEHPIHRVTLTRSFYIQTTEVTVGQFRAFVLATGYRTEAENKEWAWAYDGEKDRWVKKKVYWDKPGFPQTEDHSVACVSWNDAVQFIRWLNKKEGTGKYRLPTNAEWEYACRAGTETPFFWGRQPDGKYANFGDSSYSRVFTKNEHVNRGVDDGYVYTAPVGSLRPNPFGLFDMSGNVYEWCRDWNSDYPSGHVTDPEGPPAGKYRVIRGGSWSVYARYMRSAYHGKNSPSTRYNDVGFRVAKDF